MRSTRFTQPSSLRATVLVVLVALAALAVPVASAAARTGGTLAYQLSAKPYGIDPVHAAIPWGDGVVVGALFEGLTSLEATSSAVLPAAAVSWTPNADATVWTFHLRDGATFSNGTPVTAQDFKFAWERLLSGIDEQWGSAVLVNVKGAAAVAAGKTKQLSGVVAPDASTLVVTLIAPFADFPAAVGNPGLGPVPRGLLSTAKKAAAYRKAPVGNGAFVLAQPWNGKKTISLVTSPTYSGTKPHIAGITFTVVTDLAAAYEQFKAGTFDVCAFPSAKLDEVEAAFGTSTDGFTSTAGHQVVLGPDASTMWTVFNTRKAPLDDVRVRRAFSLAVDRKKLMDAVPLPDPFHLVCEATDALAPGIAGYDPGRWLYAKLDKAQAATLLAEAGYPGGAGLPEITFLTSDTSSKTEYKTGLAALGVKVKFIEVKQARFHSLWSSGKYMMCQDGCDYYPTAGALISNSFSGAFDRSMSFYKDPAVDAAIRQANTTFDAAARLAAFESIDATLAAASPVAPIGYYGHTIVCSARLRDAVLSQLDVFDFTAVSVE